jgi:hypothetical protein
MTDFVQWLGSLRIDNLADFGVLADTIEVVGAVAMLLGGIYITHRIQKWADKAGDVPPAANTGLGGGADRLESRSIRD